MRFAEFHVGQVIEAGPCTVSESEIIRFARAYDPQWFHLDPEAAGQRGRFGGLIASGWHTCALAMRLMVEAVFEGSECMGSPGVENIRWPHPVRPGDVLMLKAEVLEVHHDACRTGIGRVRWRWCLHKQGGVAVMDLQVVSLFDLRAAR